MLNDQCPRMLGCGQWLQIVNANTILNSCSTFCRTFADLLVSTLVHFNLLLLQIQLLIYFSLLSCWFLICFVSRDCQIFGFMKILIAISVEKLLKHVLKQGPLILVCMHYICAYTLSLMVHVVFYWNLRHEILRLFG